MERAADAPGAVGPTWYRLGQLARSRPGLPADELNPWTRAAHEWADELTAAGKRASYVEGCLRHVGWLAGDHPATATPWGLTSDQLALWLDSQPWSLTARRGVVKSLRSLYGWGIRAGHLTRSPLSGIPTDPPRPPGPGRAEVPHAWAPALDEWLTWLRACARAESTIDLRRTRLVSFARDHADPWTVTETDLARWLSRPDWAAATKRSARSTLRSFYGWAHRRELVPADPSRDLGPVRQRRTTPRPAPDDAVRSALAAADDRVTLMLHLALYAGLRRGEIASVHTRDIGHGCLLVHGKGGHERQVPMHPELARALRVELARRRERRRYGTGWGGMPTADGWLFPSTEADRHLSPSRVGELIAQAAPPGWTAHTFRHRFATQAYRVERDLRAVQELMGHAKPETTARYAAVPTGALRAAVLGVGPTWTPPAS